MLSGYTILPWFYRGGRFTDASFSGIFSLTTFIYTNVDGGFRPVLITGTTL